MKLNKKGLTLIEILVSVGIIASIMVFLFNLMLDLDYDTQYGSYAKKNRINRITIVKTVENDFIEKGVNLNTISRNFNSYHQLVIPFLDGSSQTLEVQENYIRYGTDKWFIDQDNDFTLYDVSNLKVLVSDANSCSYQLNIDSDYDGVCDINCDVNNNGELDMGDTNINYSYEACGNYQFLKITVPVKTGRDTNVILDDLEFYYIGVK